MRSDSPCAYASAVSMKLTPASRAESTMRLASASSVRSPNIIVPRHSADTLSPLLPSRLNRTQPSTICSSCDPTRATDAWPSWIASRAR